MHTMNVASPVIMVVPALPRPDTNAGDWRSFCLARILAARLPLTLVPLRPCPDGAALRSFLNRQGIEVAGVARTPHALATLVRRRRAQTVIFEKYFGVDLLPFLSLFPLVPRVVIDVHELTYLKTLRSLPFRDGAGRGLAARVREQELLLFRWADVLVAISEEEERRLRAFFPSKKIVRIPTCVPAAPRAALPFGRRSGICFPAFFDHHPNRDAAEYFLRRLLPRIREKIDAPFDLVGMGSRAIRTSGASGVHARGYVRDLTAALAAYRCVVCPLQYGAGARKKILDAAVAGTPVVSTRAGAEGVRLRDGREILVADTPDAFVRAVVRLYRDERLWERLSRQAYARVRDRYSLEAMERAVDQGLQPLLG